MKRILMSNSSVPRWVILIIDLIINCSSFSLAYFVIKEFQFPEILRGHFFIYTGTYSLISLVVFFTMRIHTGIIRYSNIREMSRIFIAVLATSILYYFSIQMVVGMIYKFHSLNVLHALLVSFFISSSTLIMMRICVRGFYHYIKSATLTKKERVLIYGSGTRAILVKQALESSNKENFDIVGFIDDGKSVNSYIQQKRIYHFNHLKRFKQKQKIDHLILMSDELTSDKAKLLVDRCLALSIKVLTVPPAEQWIYGMLSLKQMKDLKIEDLLQREPIVINNLGISQELNGKRILVTGAAGSIGSEIVRQVLQYGPDLLILCDQSESFLHDIQLEVEEKYPSIKIETFIGSVRDLHRMSIPFKKYRPEIIFHAAAYKHVPMMENHASEAIMNNVIGTKNMADLAVLFGSEKFVMISTDKAVNPSNVMGASKRIAEMYVQSLDNAAQNFESYNILQSLQQHKDSVLRINKDEKNIPGKIHPKTKFITTRFGNVLDSNGSVIPLFRSQIQKGGPVTVTHPDIIRYFMTIPEAVQLVLEAAIEGKGGEIFVFDMGSPVKINELALTMIRLAGLIPGEDIQIVYSGLRPGEKLYEELLNDKETSMETHHEKIKIAKVVSYSYKQIKDDIEELSRICSLEDNYLLVKKMKEIVPEFISNNSKYQKLDHTEKMDRN